MRLEGGFTLEAPKGAPPTSVTDEVRVRGDNLPTVYLYIALFGVPPLGVTLKVIWAIHDATDRPLKSHHLKFDDFVWAQNAGFKAMSLLGFGRHSATITVDGAVVGEPIRLDVIRED